MKEIKIGHFKTEIKNTVSSDKKDDQLFMKKQFKELMRKNLSIAIDLYQL